MHTHIHTHIRINVQIRHAAAQGAGTKVPFRLRHVDLTDVLPPPADGGDIYFCVYVVLAYGWGDGSGDEYIHATACTHVHAPTHIDTYTYGGERHAHKQNKNVPPYASSSPSVCV